MKNNNDKVDMTEQGRLLDLSEHKKKPFSQRTDLKLNKDYVVNKVSSFNTIGIFKIVFIVLLFVSMFRMMNSPTQFSVPTLGALIESLADAPDINSGVTWFLNLFNVPKFPYPFEWLSNLLGLFVECWSVVLWFGTASWNVLQFLLYIVRWLFLGV